ncbi:GTPase-activating protein GYP7 [Cocos nucifera]|uniref:GTPase-activating protein GYP7 n=1 Tax=Cocos nucifera TaxID=13894 RepID=A0A8K0IEP4_COCNU|nr:GTPase-activating protein GYP7 [Cocos nucifera]
MGQYGTNMEHYDLKSSRAERNAVRQQKRKDYEKLRRRHGRLLKLSNAGDKELKEIVEVSYAESPSFIEGHESPGSENVSGARESLSFDQGSPDDGNAERPSHNETSAPSSCHVEEEKSGITHVDDASAVETESSDTESSTEEEPESQSMYPVAEGNMETNPKYAKIASIKRDSPNSSRTAEDFATWQRIIRLDAIRANAEWAIHSPAQALISEDKALKAAGAVGLKDYDHLEPCRIYHAARLVAILEAYALYDPEIGYCQGMSDLLSPILAVMEEDHEAFWCFVGFMRKARHNFRLDEVGIRRQLKTVSKIIKFKDSHLYRHLEKLQAEDCFFVYRMVVVMFRRELTFEQTLCLWEVMWADQAAIRAGIGKSAWGRIRPRAPPTDDLLLYAIAACVLQRRKLIIEMHSSMDEIIKECNNMAGQLDVWKLLDDAHDLVVTLHDKIE